MRTRKLLLLPCLLLAPLSAQEAQVDRAKLRAAEQAARRIDKLVVQGLDGGAVGQRVDDETFVRRVYLDVAGRIPTAEETSTFLRSKKSDKRERLVDELLASPGHDSRMFHWWGELLRLKGRLNNQISGEPYIDWIHQQLRDDRPYDEMVREMLTAEGPAHERGNGATGYYLRDRGMPEDAMANTVRVFLGTRLECAQCHNHPFDKWTQKDFFQMAAFTGGMDYRAPLQKMENGRTLQAKFMELRRGGKDDRNRLRAFGRMLRSVVAGLGGSGTGAVRLPDDYQYDDARPKQYVTAKPIFGPHADVSIEAPAERSTRRRRGRQNRYSNRGLPEAHTREAFAAWMTSTENPRFTKVIANRMWKHLFGRGLVEPVDDMKDDSVASNEPLMAYLKDLMRQVDYDLTEFQRALLYSRAWQRESVSEDLAHGAPPSAPTLRRMSAEQMWDSVLTLVVPEVDGTLGRAASARAEVVFSRYEDFTDLSEKELDKRLDVQVLRYTDPDKYRRMIRQQREKDVAKRRRDRMALQKKAAPLLRDLSRARRKRDTKREAELIAKLKELGIDAQRGRRGKDRTQLVRASELPQPAPDGHFLRQFGQSDREQIEASTTEANVPQVLTLLNGFVDDHVLREESQIQQTLDREAKVEARIRMAYLTILNRQPKANELRMWRIDVAKDAEASTDDLVWTLINSHEFRFVR